MSLMHTDNDTQVQSGQTAQRKFLLADPEEAPRKARFRRRLVLVVSLTAICFLCILAARALIADWVMNTSYERWMRSDLNRLMSVQSDYQTTHGTFATIEQLGADFVPSQGVYIEVSGVAANQWTATAEHARTSLICTVSVTPASTGDRASVEPACHRR